MFEACDDFVGHRPSRTRGGGRGGARSCSVSVVGVVLCGVNIIVFRHLPTILCLSLGLPLDQLV